MSIDTPESAHRQADLDEALNSLFPGGCGLDPEALDAVDRLDDSLLDAVEMGLLVISYDPDQHDFRLTPPKRQPLP